MNTISKIPFRTGIQIASLAFTLSIAGCYDNYTAPPSAAGGSNTGGRAATTGGTANSGTGGDSSASTGGGSELGTGGTTQEAGQGGTPAASGGSHGSEEGGSPETGGSPDMAETGGVATTGGVAGTSTGGVETSTGGAATGGVQATGGVEATGGGLATGGTTQGGTGGGPVVEESICTDESGAPIPYDFSFGITSEYAFELSMSCDVGGYLMPLVLADPEQLSQVNEFVITATDWYRSAILNCPDESSTLGKDGYGFLPASESSELSGADFDASMALFMSIVDRHDGQPDQVSASKKDKIAKRIKSLKVKAVHSHAAGLTKTLPETECIPAAPAEGGG